MHINSQKSWRSASAKRPRKNRVRRAASRLSPEAKMIKDKIDVLTEQKHPSFLDKLRQVLCLKNSLSS